MSRDLGGGPLLLAPVATGALVPLVLGGTRPAIAALALLAVVMFVIWPWSVVPVSVLGGAATSAVLGLSSVSAVVAVHASMLTAGVVGLGVRGLIDPTAVRVRTASDGPMVVLAAVIGLGFIFGLARGNGSHAAVVAAYQLGIIPVYFWIASLSLQSEGARRRAMTLYLVGAVALAGVGLTMPGRHGGLLSALALVPTLVVAARTIHAGRRRALLCCGALLGVDVALCAYRSVWLATAIALILVVLRGSYFERRIVLQAMLLTVVVGIGALTFSAAARSRLDAVQTQLHASSGYRAPEAAVGLHAFADAPIFGQALGQSVPSIYIPNFRVQDIGPIYHVFYVTVLANGGLVLLVALLASMLPALRLVALRWPGTALPWVALLVGFLAAAVFAAPTDGHWELGLLVALALLERTRRREPAATLRRPFKQPPLARATRPAPRLLTPLATRTHHAMSNAHASDVAGIHAVVVTYNSDLEIAGCLAALTRCTDRIVVVDNDSTDGTADLVRERFPSVEVISNPRNVGFAAAVNQGIAGARHDTILLVNPDCVLQRGTARALRAHLRDEPDVGIVAPALYDLHGAPLISVHQFETLRTVIASRFGGALVPTWMRRRLSVGARRRMYRACAGGGGPVTVDWASGACLAVRTTLLERLGGLDEGYFMYYEDEELCLRAAQDGSRVMYLPTVGARHIGGASSSDPVAAWPALYASMMLFFARHRPGELAAVRATVFLRAGLGLLLAAARGERARAAAWRRIAVVATRRPRVANRSRP